MPPRRIGPWVLGERLGEGGMGEVYVAHEAGFLGRRRYGGHGRVALKVLSPGLATDALYVARFRREQRETSRIVHPNVVRVLGHDEDRGVLWLAMELLDGIDLAARLERDGVLPPAEALTVLGQAAAGIDAAHAEGVVHRDVKPANLVLGVDDAGAPALKVIDFGIARQIEGTSVTATSVAVGTLSYMAPERFSSRPISGAVDVYSLTAVLVECLTGAPPFTGDAMALIGQHLHARPEPLSALSRGALPRALDDVVACGLAKDPARRYRTAHDLYVAAARALGLPAAHRPPPRRTPAVPRGLAVQPVTARPDWQPEPVDAAPVVRARPAAPEPGTDRIGGSRAPRRRRRA